MTRPRSTIGDCDVLNVGPTAGAAFCQINFPLLASKADRMPLMPKVNSFPSAYTGVAFGPIPCGAAALTRSYGAA